MEMCTHSLQQKMGMEQEVEQATNGATIVQPTTWTVASSNYKPEESKKAKRRTISVDLLVVEFPRSIDQRQWNLLPVEWRSQNTLEAEEQQQYSVPANLKFKRLWQCKSVDFSPWVNKLALVLACVKLELNGERHGNFPFRRNRTEWKC